MDLSKLKIEVYDFLAVIVPGVLVICETWIALRGWRAFAGGISVLSTSAFTVILFAAFALGPVIQELSDATIKAWKGERFFKAGRDELWSSTTGDHVRSRIHQQLGHGVENVDVAYDYCLTRLQGGFSKRDLFVANSDLSRSLVVIAVLATAPMTRVVLQAAGSRSLRVALLLGGLAVLGLVATLCWMRMVRFRKLSETPVFHAFLAQPVQVQDAKANAVATV